jgi:hypothetical protein
MTSTQRLPHGGVPEPVRPPGGEGGAGVPGRGEQKVNKGRPSDHNSQQK